MINFVDITGKKTVKNYTNPTIVLTPTVGDFRIKDLAANLLGVQDGDFVAVVQHPQDAKRVFITKGIRGVQLLDENGQVIRNKAGREMFQENTSHGAICRNASNSDGLKFTAAQAWTALGGNNENKLICELGEPQEGSIPTSVKDDNGNPINLTGLFYEIIVKESVEKAKKGTGDDEDEDIVETIEGEDTFSEEETL